MPRIKPEDIEILIEEDVLTVKGTIATEEECKEGDYHIPQAREEKGKASNRLFGRAIGSREELIC